MGESAGLGGGDTFGVEGVGCEAEVDRAGVLFFRLGEELGEAGVAAEQKRQNAGGHGVQGYRDGQQIFRRWRGARG